jgi:hypothetical protein
MRALTLVLFGSHADSSLRPLAGYGFSVWSDTYLVVSFVVNEYRVVLGGWSISLGSTLVLDLDLGLSRWGNRLRHNHVLDLAP